MKKIYTMLATAVMMLFLNVASAMADDITDVKAFFDSYVNAANTYSTSVVDYYSPNARILRYVILKDGTVYPKPAVTGMDEYTKQMKISSSVAKLKKYKNYYSDIQVKKEGDNYRVSALRKPSTSDYSLQASFLIGKDSAGKYVIKEEVMQTKEQIFLKYAK